MSGDFPFAAKIVSPIKCNEKPWDLWVSEIGHQSPRQDDDGAGFTSPATMDGKGAPTRRLHDPHPYKTVDKTQTRYRRAGVNRLRSETMSLHGLFPQMDNLNAAVCHMCGVIVKCSAAYRHLLESHTGAEPILPPPPPTVKLKSVPGRSRHKKEPPPPVPIDILPVKIEPSSVHTVADPISRIVLPQPDLPYLEEASTSSAISGEVQVSVESGELPVVSIQDTEDLPLGENITDDIFAIMNSEGIQSADDITNTADWKNIIRDIGNMQEINFPSTTDTVQSQNLYETVDALLARYSTKINDTELSNLQFAPSTSPMLSSVIDNSVLNAQALKPAPNTPSTKASRKSSKTKFNLRVYDPNKHCGVVTAEDPKPCKKSLTCKTHALSLRRTVEGRAKPFDTLLAEHRASKELASAPPAPPAPLPPLPPLLVNTLDLGAFNGLTAEQQVDDIYASLLSVEEPALPDPASQTAEPSVPAAPPAPEGPPPLLQADVCWYTAPPRPLALCTFNASHAGGAVTLGKKFATVRSNIKSSLSRSNKSGAGNYYNQSLSLSKTLHVSCKSNKPEVRKLIVTCSAAGVEKEHQTLSELFGGEVRHALNGHVGLSGHAGLTGLSGHAGLTGHPGLAERKTKLKGSKRAAGATLDLGFALDPLLADEKC